MLSKPPYNTKFENNMAVFIIDITGINKISLSLLQVIINFKLLFLHL